MYTSLKNVRKLSEWLIFLLRLRPEFTGQKNGVTTDMTSLSKYLSVEFNVHRSLRRESMSIIVQQDATMYSLLYFCKLLYMFRVVTPPIIRRTYNYNYSIWHWSNFGKCSVWSQLKVRGMDPSLLPSAIAEGNRDGSLADVTHCIFRRLTSARCCNYSYMCPRWWVELPAGTCRAVYRNIINSI